MSNQQPLSFNIVKLMFQKLNTWLSAHNSKKQPKIWHRVFKWNYDHHLLKNILKLSNKILKGLNKYHVFKIDYVYLALGMGLGFAVNYIEDNWDRAKNVDIEAPLAELIIDKVLKNQAIRLKLQEVVNDNVLTNEDIQTNLHFVLMNKVLIPQRENIKKLTKQAIISALKSDQLLKIAEQQTVIVIQKSKPLIAREALNFLGGDDMQKILIKVVPPLIRSEMVQTTVSKEVIGFVASQLNNEVNQEKVYSYLREKVI